MKELFLKADIEEIVDRLGNRVQNFSGKNILLCGGNGFLGKYFVDIFIYLNNHVLNKPCLVSVVDNFIVSSEGSVSKTTSNIRFLHLDVCDSSIIDSDSKDYIIHTAGIASPVLYRKYPLQTIEVSTVGTKNLLELAKKSGSRFLFFSSSEIYGDPNPKYIPTPETYCGNVSCLGPRACYDESKRLGETITNVYFNLYNVPVNIVRPFNIYGPGMKSNDFRVLPNFASCIFKEIPLQVYGSGNQTRTYCYVTDAMVGFLKVLLEGKSGEVYNIGNDKPEVSVFGLVNEMEKVLSRKLTVIKNGYPKSYPSVEPNRRCPDISKAKRELDYVPKVDLRNGLKRFLGWTKEYYCE